MLDELLIILLVIALAVVVVFVIGNRLETTAQEDWINKLGVPSYMRRDSYYIGYSSHNVAWEARLWGHKHGHGKRVMASLESLMIRDLIYIALSVGCRSYPDFHLVNCQAKGEPDNRRGKGGETDGP